MEEAKAAAYYEDLTRRGEGAARFKQGLGFSSAKSDSENAPARGSAVAYTSSSSFMSKFVKASSPSKTTELEKQAQIQSIQNKLKRKKPEELAGEEEKRPPRVSERDKRSRSRERDSRHRSRSRERYRDRDRDRERRRRRRRSRSGSESDGDRRRRSRSPRNRRKDRRRSRSRSSSPRRERGLEKSRGKLEKERSGGGADYNKLIQGYDKMSAAERVKAKMKLQLAETAEKDTTKGMDGWERFEFDKDAPLDDEEIEVAEDDAALVNHIGKSFRFSAFETKREERIKAAHDEAMFGASDNQPSIMIDSDVEVENDNKDCKESEPPSLLSEKVLAKKQGSWRDRIRHNN
ncbi:luc7-like protein 3 [Rosa sericea]